MATKVPASIANASPEELQKVRPSLKEQDQAAGAEIGGAAPAHCQLGHTAAGGGGAQGAPGSGERGAVAQQRDSAGAGRALAGQSEGTSCPDTLPAHCVRLFPAYRQLAAPPGRPPAAAHRNAQEAKGKLAAGAAAACYRLTCALARPKIM